MEKNKKKFNFVKFSGLSVLFFIFVVPFLLVLMNSLKTNQEFITNPIALPARLNIENYINAFERMNFVSSFFNSLIVSFFSVALIVFLSSMTAHVFVRKKWKLNQFVFFLMIASMMIPFQAIMIPLVKIYGSMHLLNSKWCLIYMHVGFQSSMAVFIYNGFIKSIPLELEEAAMIDGCTKLQTFFKIVFPLLKPTTMTIVILYTLFTWNDFLLPSLVLKSVADRTLPLSTFIFFGTYSVDYALLLAGLMMVMIPVLVLYLFIQKHIISGVMQGSIK